MKNLKEEINVSVRWFSLQKEKKDLLNYKGGARKDINHTRWMVSRHNKDGVPRSNSTLDFGKRRGEMDHESCRDWV
jgi:hypothetical protein